jgi:hypothetical protein
MPKMKGGEIKIPKTKKFRRLLRATQKFYGKKKGKQIAYAYARKHKWRI